jgi:hypothetical protein
MSPLKKTETTTSPSSIHAYLEAGKEPSIAEVLAEPIVRAVMRRDAISEAVLVGVIDRAREELDLCAA